MLRLVTYNIHFGKRLIDIMSWITTQAFADIICLQEVPLAHVTAFYRSLPRGWGHRSTKSFIYRKKTFVLVTLFRKNKLRLLQAKTLLMGVHPMEKTILKNPMEKSCLVTTFRQGRNTVTVANTHLVFLAANRSRYKQIRMITDHLTRHNHALLITGDFNIPSVRSKNKLVSYMKTFGFRTSGKRLLTYRWVVWKYQLDYLFVKRCTLSSLTPERVRFSDHYPIAAEVRLSH